MKYGITQWSYPGNGIYAMPFVKEAGYDGMQIELGGLDDGFYMSEPKLQKMYMEEAGRLGLEFPSIVLNDLMYHGIIGSKDGVDYKSAVMAQDLIVEAAHAMNIPYIMLPFFYESDCTGEHNFERAVEYLREICKKAAKYDLMVGAETPLNWDKQIELEEAVGADNLDTFFDTINYAWYYGYSQVENLNKLYPHMGTQVHVCDGTGTKESGGPNGGAFLGKGDGQVLEQLEILRTNEFDGWLIIENMYKLPEFFGLETDPYELAAQELRFLKEQMEGKAA